MEIKPTGNLAHFIPPHSGTDGAVSPTQIVSTSSIKKFDSAKKIEPNPSDTQVDTALQNINQAMDKLAPNLEFSYDKESNRTIVKVVDRETQEIIRQMPSKEALEIAKALDKLQGLLIHQKV